jgi:uncharacterized protein YbjT (DUF2867 family)
MGTRRDPPRGTGTAVLRTVTAGEASAAVDAVAAPGLHGQVLKLGGPGNLTFNQVAALLQWAADCPATVRHIPCPALHAMVMATAGVKPALARQGRAALAMDTIDMTFELSRTVAPDDIDRFTQISGDRNPCTTTPRRRRHHDSARSSPRRHHQRHPERCSSRVATRPRAVFLNVNWV